jgi:hypothetical protein
MNPSRASWIHSRQSCPAGAAIVEAAVRGNKLQAKYLIALGLAAMAGAM